MYFPALKAHMGDWEYYSVKMSMQELAGAIELAQDVYDDHTLSDAMQRVLGESRAKGDIARYLINNDGFSQQSLLQLRMEIHNFILSRWMMTLGLHF